MSRGQAFLHKAAAAILLKFLCVYSWPRIRLQEKASTSREQLKVLHLWKQGEGRTFILHDYQAWSTLFFCDQTRCYKEWFLSSLLSLVLSPSLLPSTAAFLSPSPSFPFLVYVLIIDNNGDKITALTCHFPSTSPPPSHELLCLLATLNSAYSVSWWYWSSPMAMAGQTGEEALRHPKPLVLTPSLRKHCSARQHPVLA